MTRRPPTSRDCRALSFCALTALVWGPYAQAQAADATPRVVPKVLRSLHHDQAAFTQGLEVARDIPGHFFESTGQYGASTIRIVEIDTGRVTKEHALEHKYFGEGVTRVGSMLVQLTWQAGVALRYDAKSFAPQPPWTYEGEGWGLCFDGQTLWMSNGTDKLVARDPSTFAIKQTLSVRYNDQPLTQLNELECARGSVFANVWHQDWIAQIDPKTGEVSRRIDAGVLRQQQGLSSAGVLNGIAYRPETDTFFLTGKNWSKIFEVEIARNAACPGGSGTPGNGQGATPGVQADQKTSSGKRRGCALLQGHALGQSGLMLALGCIVGLGQLRRPRSKRVDD